MIRLVTASADHTARIWDGRTGRFLRPLRGHFFGVRTASFSPDGRWVVTSSQFTAGLWNASTGELVLYLRGHAKPLTGASFGPNELIVTASEVRDWNALDFAHLTAENFSQLATLGVEIVLLGTGSRQRFPHPRLTAALGAARIGLEVMDSKAACRTYNILVAEERRVALALLFE